MEEIIYFEINNWFAGRDYPADEIFSKWIQDYQFRKDDWCKENKLCVMCGAIDMSMNLCYPDEDGEVCGHIADDWYFPEYKEENFGVTWNDSWWGDDNEDDNED